VTDDKISGSRLGRWSKLLWTSRHAIPLATSRWRGTNRKASADADASAAEAFLETLGSLKGLALKAGQMLSYMEGILPADVEPTFQRVLAKLQSAADPLPWSAIEPVLIAELGAVEPHFASLEREPFAAASIGQVHRGTLSDGTAVAVKIQYPGVAKAVEVDLSSIETLKFVMTPLLGLAGARQNVNLADSVVAELRARLLEELDYSHEAIMQMRFRQLFAASKLRIPAVYLEHSSRNVLTTELVQGLTLDEAARCDAASRNAWGETLVRAVTQQLYVDHLFHADPHPGNYLFHDDAEVTLLDFGCVKRIPPNIAADIEGYLRAAIVATRSDRRQDWAVFDEVLGRAYNLDGGDPSIAGFYHDFMLLLLEPMLRDAPFEFHPEFVARINQFVIDRKKQLVFGAGRLPRIPRLPPIPADYTFLNRLEWGFFSVLTRLRARVNWHALLPERIRLGD
jgi:predicted unusual protein kinase regulating ubiquinone biosynthesis (AarF/ABC1/UbiB family)